MSIETANSSSRLLVTDFDGTMTQFDFYQLAIARLLPPNSPDYWGEFLAGRLTHFAALQQMFALIRADEADIMAVVEEMQLDAKLASSVQQLQAWGWDIVIASAGCNWYIERLLYKHGVTLPVHANPGYWDPVLGLVMTSPTASPYFTMTTGIDKEAVMREALRTCSEVAFAGDGRPDLPAALLAPPERRFACGWLAQYFSTAKIPYRQFGHWSEIAEALA